MLLSSFQLTELFVTVSLKTVRNQTVILQVWPAEHIILECMQHLAKVLVSYRSFLLIFSFCRSWVKLCHRGSKCRILVIPLGHFRPIEQGYCQNSCLIHILEIETTARVHTQIYMYALHCHDDCLGEGTQIVT